MKFLRLSLPLSLLWIFALSYIFFFYGDIILAPNSFMFDQFGDGLKNYFTYAYHIKYGSSTVNFEGMNYPYGEHFLYTDCHPVFAFFLKKIVILFPSIADYSIGILNSILLASFLLTFWVLYRLLRELQLKTIFATIFAIGIFLMIPQIERISGHFALSYGIAIPLSWLLLLKLQKNPTGLNTSLFFINNLFWLFIHAYLGMIVLSFLAMITFIELIVKSKGKSLLQRLKPLLSVLLPILIFYVFAKLSDQHIGRTDNPSGFFLYYAEFDNIIIPSYGPLWSFWKTLIPSVNLEGEGNAYVGLANVLLLSYLLLLGLSSWFYAKNKIALRTYFQNDKLNISLAAAFVILLLSMGIPFVQLPNLLEYFPIFKQFRAIGRFSWPFYFAFTVFAAYQWQRIILKLPAHKKWISITLNLLLFSIPIFESVERHQYIASKVKGKANLFNQNFLDDHFNDLIETIEADKYQAIFSLPFYHHGSEAFERPRNELAMHNTIALSYHLGIPNIGANLTRSSIPESKKIIQLISPNYYKKAIQEEMDTDQPFLLVHSNTELSQYEMELLKRAKPIKSMSNDVALYELSYSSLFEDQRSEVIKNFETKRNTLHKKGSFYLSDSSSYFFLEEFEGSISDTSIQGNGAYYGEKKGKNTLAKFPPKTFVKGKSYSIKLWMYNGEPDALNLRFKLNVLGYDSEKGQWRTIKTLYPELAETINGNWSLVEGEFKLEDTDQEIFIMTKGNKFSKASLRADNLLIMEKGLELYRIEENGDLFYNNHLIRSSN